MSGRTGRSTGPRIAPARPTGPRVAAPQPATPPTAVQLGGDRVFGGAREVDFRQLTPDPDQPRKSMNPDRLAELSESIVAHGLLQPIVVRQAGLDLGGDMRYVVVAGGRRYAAIQMALERTTDEATRARLLRVPVVINDSEAAERRVLQLIENLQREDLNAIEEARALKEIARIEGLTTTGLAVRVHRSQGYVDERLRLLRHEDVQDAVETGLLTKSAGAAIASLRSADERRDWIDRAKRGEVVRPREIYATKKRKATPSGADPAALARLRSRAIELRGMEPELSRDEAFHLAAVEARQRGDLDLDTAARTLGAAALMADAERETPAEQAPVVDLPSPPGGADLPARNDDAPRPAPVATPPSARELAERLVNLTYAQQALDDLRQARERLALVQDVPDDQLRADLLRELTAFGNAALEVIARLRS
jgi:ParB family chromosome partitioning protein